MDHTRAPSLRGWARGLGLTLWGSFLIGGLYLYVFRHNWIKQELATLPGSSPLLIAAVYLALGGARGFSLVPATYLLFDGIRVDLRPAAKHLTTAPVNLDLAWA